MEWLRNRKNRFMVSLAAGMAACILAAGCMNISAERERLAWWGTLYPKFCFAKLPEKEEETGEESAEAAGGLKISFWLAQVWD